MTVDSPSPPSPPSSPSPPGLPPARPRARPAASVSAAAEAAAADASGDEPDEITPTPSLIGDGPGQYLLGCENRRSFNEMKAAFDRELRPADPIERMWVDEIVDLEWDLHRLRGTRRAVLEAALADRLAAMATMGASAAGVSALSAHTQLRAAALGCVRGVPAAQAVIRQCVGSYRIADELQLVQSECADILARLGQSIHATSRLRDGILTRLYGRRDAKTRGRIRSGHAP